MTTSRTDIHRPQVLVTEDYRYVGAFDAEPPRPPHPLAGPAGIEAYARAREFWLQQRDHYWHEVGVKRSALADRRFRQCHHCGARVRYVAILMHLPTGSAIVVGETCLDNRFERSTADFQRLRRAAQLDRERMRIVNARAAFAEEHPDLAFMAALPYEAPKASRDNSFVEDVARRLCRYGELSERQVAAVRTAVARDAERAAARAVREAAEAAAQESGAMTPVPCHGQRMAVVGEVLSTRWVESSYGATQKMLVRVDDGQYKLWGTVPAALANIQVGDRVAFQAMIATSPRDAYFGFFSRPTQARFLTDLPVGA